MASGILNYTTKVPVTQSVSEITQILVKHKASAIMSEYDDNGKINSICFRLKTPQGIINYRLPVNVRGVMRSLKGKPKEEQAARVAWRICKDWIEAQLAIVQANMADTAQVFLPYAITSTGQTVYEKFKVGGAGTIGITYESGEQER